MWRICECVVEREELGHSLCDPFFFGARLDEYDVIGIDEGQFYPDLVEMVDAFLRRGKVVVVSALDGDFRRKPFGRILELIPMAVRIQGSYIFSLFLTIFFLSFSAVFPQEKVTKLTAVCTFCGRDAPFTRRITTETEVEVIGGSDKYVSSCRACFELPMDAHLTPKLEKHWQALGKLNQLKVQTVAQMQTSPVKHGED